MTFSEVDISVGLSVTFGVLGLFTQHTHTHTLTHSHTHTHTHTHYQKYLGTPRHELCGKAHQKQLADSGPVEEGEGGAGEEPWAGVNRSGAGTIGLNESGFSLHNRSICIDD
jgi:hypothetical protein